MVDGDDLAGFGTVDAAGIFNCVKNDNPSTDFFFEGFPSFLAGVLKKEVTGFGTSTFFAWGVGVGTKPPRSEETSNNGESPESFSVGLARVPLEENKESGSNAFRLEEGIPFRLGFSDNFCFSSNSRTFCRRISAAFLSVSLRIAICVASFSCSAFAF